MSNRQRMKKRWRILAIALTVSMLVTGINFNTFAYADEVENGGQQTAIQDAGNGDMPSTEGGSDSDQGLGSDVTPGAGNSGDQGNTDEKDDPKVPEAEPGLPGTDQPGNSGGSAEGEKPVDPEAPVVPGTPVDPEAPAVPEVPATSGGAATTDPDTGKPPVPPQDGLEEKLPEAVEVIEKVVEVISIKEIKIDWNEVKTSVLPVGSEKDSSGLTEEEVKALQPDTSLVVRAELALANTEADTPNVGDTLSLQIELPEYLKLEANGKKIDLMALKAEDETPVSVGEITVDQGGAVKGSFFEAVKEFVTPDEKNADAAAAGLIVYYEIPVVKIGALVEGAALAASRMELKCGGEAVRVGENVDVLKALALRMEFTFDDASKLPETKVTFPLSGELIAGAGTDFSKIPVTAKVGEISKNIGTIAVDEAGVAVMTFTDEAAGLPAAELTVHADAAVKFRPAAGEAALETERNLRIGEDSYSVNAQNAKLTIKLLDEKNNEMNSSSAAIDWNKVYKLQVGATIPDVNNELGDQVRPYTNLGPYEFELPECFVRPESELSVPLLSGEGGTAVGEFRVSKEGNAQLLFYNSIVNSREYYDIFANGTVELKFDKDSTGEGGKFEIKFSIPGQDFIIYVTVPEKEPEKIIVKKSGEYIATEGAIQWTISVDPKGNDLSGLTLWDDLSTILKGKDPASLLSVEVRSQDASSKESDWSDWNALSNGNVIGRDYQLSGSAFSYTFAPKQNAGGEGEDGADPGFQLSANQDRYEFRLKTRVDDTTNKDFKNTAWLMDGDKGITSGAATVAVKSTWITKSGKFIENKENGKDDWIHWTIEINKNKRTISNARIIDNIPAGLEFKDGSLKVSGNGEVLSGSAINKLAAIEKDGEGYFKPGYLYDKDGTVSGSAANRLSYYFGKSIDDTYTIEFDTVVLGSADGGYVGKPSYQNTAVLEYDQLDGFGVNGSWSGSGTVGLGSSHISKTGKYSRSTGILSWTVTVKPFTGFTNVKQIQVKDYIEKNQVYDPSSLRIDGMTQTEFEKAGGMVKEEAPVDYAGTKNVKSTGGRYLTIQFSEEMTGVNQQHVITFDTTPNKSSQTAGNGGPVGYDNFAQLIVTVASGAVVTNEEDQAKVQVSSNVIGKAGKYDYTNGNEIDWTITVNDNQMMMETPYVEDFLPAGWNYVTGSAVLKAVNAGTGAAVEADVRLQVVEPGSTTNGALKFIFVDGSGKPVSIHQKYEINFKTQTTDENLQKYFEKNQTMEVTNKAVLYSMSIDKGRVETSATVKLKSELIKKVALNSDQTNYVNWNIRVNPVNLKKLTEAYIIDPLSDKLVVDTESIQMYKMTLKPDGSLETSKTPDPDFDPENDVTIKVEINEAGNRAQTLKVRLPNPNQAYLLTFGTHVRPGVSEVNNTAQFIGNGVDAESDPIKATGIKITGEGGFNTLGRIAVTKVDADNTGKKLANAAFTLERKGGSNAKRTEYTDASGKLEFDALAAGTYIVKEAASPDNYDLNPASWEITLEKGKDGVTKETITVGNKLIQRDVTFKKVDDLNQPLPGAEFTLYKVVGNEAGVPKLEPVLKDGKAVTAISDENGLVTFRDVPVGEYVAKETAPPAGHILGEISEVNITVHGTGDKKGTVTLSTDSVTNVIIRGDIQITKTNVAGDLLLKGAEFTLYDADGKIVDVQVTSDSGIALFQGISYGKYTIEETAAPSGYIRSTEKIAVEITENGSVVSFTVKNVRRSSGGGGGGTTPTPPIEIPDNEVPLGPGPGDLPGTEDSGLEEIPDGDVPLGSVDGLEPETTDIPDGEVPLAQGPGRLPQTGGLVDSGFLTGLGLLLLAAGYYLNRKKESTEN